MFCPLCASCSSEEQKSFCSSSHDGGFVLYSQKAPCGDCRSVSAHSCSPCLLQCSRVVSFCARESECLYARAHLQAYRLCTGTHKVDVIVENFFFCWAQFVLQSFQNGNIIISSQYFPAALLNRESGV